MLTPPPPRKTNMELLRRPHLAGAVPSEHVLSGTQLLPGHAFMQVRYGCQEGAQESFLRFG